MEIFTRFLTLDDAQALLELYRSIASRPGGFLRMEDEIGPDYVQKALGRGVQGGVAIGAFDRTTGTLIGSITTRKLELKVFEHVLSGLIIGVHPEYQRRGVGRRLFLDLLEHVQSERPDILRIELVARESNVQQILFYESIGFRREGSFEKRIRRPDGAFEADIPMGWLKQEFF